MKKRYKQFLPRKKVVMVVRNRTKIQQKKIKSQQVWTDKLTFSPFIHLGRHTQNIEPHVCAK